LISPKRLALALHLAFLVRFIHTLTTDVQAEIIHDFKQNNLEILRTRKAKCKANASRFIFFAAVSILERDTRSVQSASLHSNLRTLYII
jgi:hypothetical protein